MGLDSNYVKKVCYNFKDKNSEYSVNYLFENPYDTGAL